jgi:hypothetical protein
MTKATSGTAKRLIQKPKPISFFVDDRIQQESPVGTFREEVVYLILSPLIVYSLYYVQRGITHKVSSLHNINIETIKHYEDFCCFFPFPLVVFVDDNNR